MSHPTSLVPVLLKDRLFNLANVTQLADDLQRVYPPFDTHSFIEQVMAPFPTLELKARIGWITTCLYTHLPPAYPEAVGIILRALPPPINPLGSDNDFGDFIYAPYAMYVARYGCSRQYLALSLDALKAITTRCSAEDAIRYLINGFPNETLAVLHTWTQDPHYHVRRLCSEGTRPRLPWAINIHVPPTEPLPILTALFADRTRFVTRSVANHLNDLSTRDPERVTSLLVDWAASGQQTPHEMGYITRHALRTLVKQGHAGALRVLGIDPDAKVRVVEFRVSTVVRLDTHLEVEVTLIAEEEVRVVVDYLIHFQNREGKLTRKKIFKLKQLRMVSGERVTLYKRHLFRRGMTVRPLYVGGHRIEIQMNGKRVGEQAFEVVDVEYPHPPPS